jgi:prolyl oligopeptidase
MLLDCDMFPALHFMKRCFYLLIFAGISCAADDKPVYPKPPTSSQTDDYFGTKVADPYRPLEDLDSPATRKWIEEENKLTFDYLAKIPERKEINERLTALWDYAKYAVPFQEGGNYFFSKNSGLQNQSVLYVTSALPGEPRVLIDPNTLSADGTVALSGMAVPPNGKLLAYGLATAGSDWQEWKVREIVSLLASPRRSRRGLR